MTSLLLIIQVILAVAIILIVLLQRSDSDGMGGLGGGGGGLGLVSGRTKASMLTRTTAILAGLFMLNSLLLSIITARMEPSSLLDTIPTAEAPAVPGGEAQTPLPVVAQPEAPVEPMESNEAPDSLAQQPVAQQPVSEPALEVPAAQPSDIPPLETPRAE